MLKDVIIANKIYAKLNLSDAQGMDEIAIKVIRQDTPDFVLPFKVIDIDGETELRYEIGDGMRLNYLPDNMTKSELLILLENMLRPFKECNDWLLDYHSFYLDKNYIIVGKDYLNVKYVYIPNANCAKTDAEMLQFFEELVWNVTLKDDPMYVMSLCRRLKDKQTTLFSLLEYVSQELGGNANQMKQEPTLEKVQMNAGNMGDMVADKAENTKQEVKKQEASLFDKFGFGGSSASKQSAPSAPVPEPVVSQTPTPTEEKFGKDDIQGNLIKNLFAEEASAPAGKEAKKEKEKKIAPVKEPKEKKGFFDGLFGSGKNVEKAAPPAQQRPVQYNADPVQQHTPLQKQEVPYAVPMDSSGSNATQIFSMEDLADTGNKIILQLEEDGGYPFPKVIELDFSNRNYVVLGRYDKSGTPQADYNFEAAFSFISRRHLRIEKNGEQVTVVDLNSGNGSMINNDILVPNMPYTVRQGDRIVFSKAHRISYRVR